MSVLVDTNVLLRRAQPGHEHHGAAIDSVAKLIESGEATHFTLQNISEFWNVATRPIANNGLAFPIALARRQVEKIESAMTLLPDLPDTYAEWKRLVIEFDVKGVKVHDARLVAVMNVHEVNRLLTFNSSDFTRFGIEIIDPQNVASS